MKIVWHEPKRLANLEKHGLDFADLDEEFFLASTIRTAKAGRLMAIGWMAGGVVAVVFARLGAEGISIISMRPANQAERDCLMAKPKLNATTAGREFQPGKGFSKEDWDAVSDNPEWTEEDFKNARPFAEVFPKLAESIRRSRGRPALDNPKKQVTLRLDSDVVAHFRAGGPGWQSRINDILRKAAGLQK